MCARRHWSDSFHLDADDALGITERRQSKRLRAMRSRRHGKRALMWMVALRVGIREVVSRLTNSIGGISPGGLFLRIDTIDE